MAFKVESWEKFMKVYAGWSPDKTANSIKNYGEAQVKDFLRDAEQTFNRQLTHGVGRTLGSFANSFNPAAIDKQSKSAKNAALDREKTNVYAGLNNLKQMATNWKDILDKSAIDTVNGLVASAATWYGEDVVKSVGFVPGGASEVKVDLIGEVTGQSQPQTFKIDQKTGEVSGGDITPISKAKEVEATGETSPEAKTLARTMLLRDETTDLGMNPIWQSAPDDVRKQAFQELKRITSSPESMADFVIENEVQDLQNYKWWASNPNKQRAWQLISQSPQRTLEAPEAPAIGEIPLEAPPGTTYVDGKLSFSTGNPQFDDFLNNTYVPLLEAEFAGGDPNAIFNTEAFASIKDRVDKTWGSKFAQELKLAQESFDLSKTGLEAEQTKTLGDIGTEKARTIEDVGEKRQRIARNYSQAQQESALAMASRKLTFGGTRKKEEAKLGEEQAMALGDVEKAGKRTLEDLQGREEFAKGAFGRQLAGQQATFAEEKRRMEGELPVKYAEERANIRTLGSQLLNNPEFFPQT